MMQKLVYLNGEYLPLADAKISVLDRGFLFGDGVYEVIPVFAGKFFCLEAHLHRLNASLQQTQLPVNYSIDEWQQILEPLLAEIDSQYIYLQVTRGVAEKRDHSFSADLVPTIFAMCSPISSINPQGVKAITLDDTRWKLCHIKATTLLANILLRQQAVEDDCAEAILIKDEMVTEGAASNVFAVIEGILVTPPENKKILSGITRQVILELAQQHKIAFAERKMPLKELQSASEIWLTSSTREILAVTYLDSKAVGDGKVGTVWQQMNPLYQQYKTTL